MAASTVLAHADESTRHAHALDLGALFRSPALDRTLLAAAAAAMPAPRSLGQHRWSDPGTGIRDGRTVTLSMGPGIASLSVVDRVRLEASTWRADRTARAHRVADLEQVHEDARTPLVGVPATGEARPSRFIDSWSRKSRSRMLRAFVSVDWTAAHVPGAPLGMVTLTYPGDWLAVAPNGRTVKRHLRAFCMRYRRAVGVAIIGAWKLEFQTRGAPHFHILMPVPAMVGGETFELWLSRVWASIVKAEHCGCRLADLAGCCERSRHLAAGTGVDFGPTGRSSDPKRLGVYFMKHGSKTRDGKEYQHTVPREWLVDEQGEVTPGNGPGRFWGFWGLKPATVAVELDAEDYVTARRVLRRVAAARARSIQYGRLRRMGASPALAVTWRRPRTHVLAGSRMVGGFVVVNDGPRLAADLARAINLARLDP